MIATALAVLSFCSSMQDAPPFPTSTPSEQGLDPQALQLLVDEVERLLAADAFVGAELHVIKNRHTVLHRAFGDADRDAARPLEVDAIFCVRSMTKPLVGTAIQMLLDEGRLTLQTKASAILPAYDTPGKADITIEQLLTHRTGLPFTTITRPLSGYATLGDVAAEAAATELLFEPGTDFQYSDAGSDTLGAIVAALTGEPVEAFLQARILDPLGMHDSLTLLAPGSPELARIPSAYSGGAGAWQRHWSSADAVMFPIFLTSQSLYATTTDYARFLALWMDGGRGLLSPEAIERGWTPRSSLPAPCGFDGLQPFYGQQWTIYAAADALGGSEQPPAIFGHAGSDGTFAWAWPERDLIVLCFTQSRGMLAGTELEYVLDRVLIDGDVEGYREELRARALAAADLAPYEGLYWDEDNVRAYYVVQADGERLTIERPGAFSTGLLPTGTAGHFKLEGLFTRTLEFEPPVDGASPAFLFPFSNRVERQTRHRPQPDVPSVESIVAGLHQAHGLDARQSVGTVRMLGKLEMKSRGVEGRVVVVFDERRARIKATMGESSESVWITADDRVFSRALDAEPAELQGIEREQALHGHPLRILGDWRDDYASVEVLRTVEVGDQTAVLVRTVSDEGAGSTKIIDPRTGRLMAEDRFEVLPGVGRVGIQVDYADFRDVGGLTLPFRIRSEYSSELIGEILVTFDRVDIGIDAESSLKPPSLP